MWRYGWNAAGLLEEVQRPDGWRVRFGYDPFARPVEKQLLQPAEGARLEAVTRTRFVWDGDVLVHELTERAAAEGDPVVEQRTYLYEDDSFEPVPVKLERAPAEIHEMPLEGDCQIGGSPAWVQEPVEVRCRSCDEQMVFVFRFASPNDFEACPPVANESGALYYFACASCSRMVQLAQWT